MLRNTAQQAVRSIKHEGEEGYFEGRRDEESCSPFESPKGHPAK